MTYRVLITGSRDWTDRLRIKSAFEVIDEAWCAEIESAGEWVPPPTLVSGHCPTGADFLCENMAWELKWDIELHPADWETHGKRAGFIRNSEMVKLGADVCLAFIKNNSKGASMTAKLAQDAGIVTIIHREV